MVGVFEKKGPSGTKTTRYTVKIEENNWDLIIFIFDTPEQKFEELLKERKKYGLPILIGIEYKSSVNEWGKQIDSFFRQIKTRIGKTPCDLHMLFSFDERFEEYAHACHRAGLGLIVLPLEALKEVIKEHLGYDLFK